MVDNQEVFDDIVLSELSDKELTEQMSEDLYDGLAEEIAEGTQILLDRGWEATDIMDEALVKGMVVVGDDFRDGILFVPEVLMAANAMKAGMALLEPILTASGIEPIAKMVIGTVKGDIHDIGKNLVGMMMEGAGIEVFNLGINTDAEDTIQGLQKTGTYVEREIRKACDRQTSIKRHFMNQEGSLRDLKNMLQKSGEGE